MYTMQIHRKETLCHFLRPQARNIWKSSYSSCQCPCQSKSNFKKDCLCFFANNSLKGNLFSIYNGSILQHGKTGCIQKKRPKHLSVLQNLPTPTTLPYPQTTTFPTGKRHAKRGPRRIKAHLPKKEIFMEYIFCSGYFIIVALGNQN